ncbi:LexA family transcriptional regulator [Aquipseudomonas campi]
MRNIDSGDRLTWGRSSPKLSCICGETASEGEVSNFFSVLGFTCEIGAWERSCSQPLVDGPRAYTAGLGHYGHPACVINRILELAHVDSNPEYEPEVHTMTELKVQASPCDIEPMVQTTEEIRRAFVARLKSAASAKGIDEWGLGARLAEITGKTAKAASKWLNEESMPGRVNMQAVASALDVRVEWLQFGVGPREVDGASKESNVIKAEFRPAVRPAMIEVPHLDNPGSMGRGMERKVDDRVIDHLTIDRAYLKSLVSFSLAENLALITGYGDSMKPTFSDGDIMLVDRGVTEVKIDAVYVLAKNDELFIKRLQRRSDGSFLMISDNKAYEPESISDMDRFEVLGRVIYVWAGSKL